MYICVYIYISQIAGALLSWGSTSPELTTLVRPWNTGSMQDGALFSCPCCILAFIRHGNGTPLIKWTL